MDKLTYEDLLEKNKKLNSRLVRALDLLLDKEAVLKTNNKLLGRISEFIEER